MSPLAQTRRSGRLILLKHSPDLLLNGVVIVQP